MPATPLLTPEQIARLQEGNGLYSQARNFLSHVQTGVDARTGQYTLAVNMPIGFANHLAGPSVSATLTFSSMASLIDRGFGYGWSMMFSELDIRLGSSPSIRLSSGDQYAVDRDKSDFSVGGQLVFRDRKLDSFTATRITSDCYEVVMKTGEVEHLYVEVTSGLFITREVYSPEGRRVTLEWTPVGDGVNAILRQISDDSRVLFRVQRDSGEVHFVNNPNTPRETRLTLSLLNQQLRKIILPDDARTAWEVTYETYEGLLFPVRVVGPLGSTDEVSYYRQNEGHQFPPNAPLVSMARVRRCSHTAGLGQPVLHSEYEWRGNNNFVGYGASMPGGWKDGEDNLYRTTTDYRYSVTETQSDASGVLRTIERTWNRFHLLTRELTRHGKTADQKIVDVVTQYDEDPQAGWDTQPPWCQLPAKVITTYQDANGSRAESTETTYDDWGNVLTSRNQAGVVEAREYYPAAGDGDRCPADPYGYVRWLKTLRVIPAVLDDGSHGGAPVLSTTYTYQTLPSLRADSPASIVSRSEHMTDETAGVDLETTEQTHIDDLGDFHGMPLQAITTLNGIPTTTRFAYTLENDQLHTESRIIGFENDDLHTAIESDARSLFDGLTVMQESYAGARTLFEYDALGRAVRTTIAAGSAYEAVRICTFQMTGQARADLPMFEETDVNKVRQRKWLDGDGHEIRVELEDVDTQVGLFRDIARTVLDAQGRPVEETVLDWLPGQAEPLTMLTRTTYDDWGEAATVTAPTGVITHTQSSPVTQQTRSWTESTSGRRSAASVTTVNTAGSPIRVELYDANDKLVRTTHNQRDGLDQIIEERIEIAGEPDIVTLTRYDAYKRVVEKVLPDGTTVNWTYAAHSDGDHPESVSVTEAQDHAPA